MKKIIKKITAILLILSITVSFAGCGEVSKAERTVNNTFKALQNLDFNAASNYVDLDEVLSKESNSDADTESEESKALLEKLFSKFQYEIISSEKIDKETVIVKAKITTIDMKPVMTEFMQKLLQYSFANAFADPAPTEEESSKATINMLIECLSAEDLALVTNEVDIKVIKVDKKWKIEASEEFSDALLGGLLTVADDLSNSLNDIG